MSIRPTPRRRDERGAMAIIVALLSVVLMMAAALGVNIAQQVSARHSVQNNLDSAAQAGAFDLDLSTGSATRAKADALVFAAKNAPTSAPAPFVDFFCVVASTGTAPNFVVDTTQIPATCNPGTSPYTVAHYPGLACSKILCAIPCPLTGTGISCNTIRVSESRNVPFTFGAAGGITHGSTGSVISVACKGSCGTIAPNPMDVTVVADRTGSMSSTDVNSMISGIKSMLTVMQPGVQYVSLGTIGRSATTNRSTATCNSSSQGLTYPSGSATSGQWIPVAFYNDYLSGSTTNASSNLIKGINCLTTASGTGTALASPFKAAARYLLGKDANNLSSLPNRAGNVSKVLIFETDGQPNEEGATGGSASLDSSSDIFSNNGNVDSSGPVTSGPANSSVQTTTNTRKVGSTNYTDTYKTTYAVTTKTTTVTADGGQNACNNLKTVAQNARAAGILVITIAYNLSGAGCGDGNTAHPSASSNNNDGTPVITNISPAAAASSTSPWTLNTSYKGNATITQTTPRTTTQTVVSSTFSDAVTNVLAAVASPNASGTPSSANNDCGTTAGRNAENSDGDYFFCAATGSDMASIFKTALSQASGGIKLLSLP